MHDKTYNKTCDQRRLRSACASSQSDQSPCWSHVPSTASTLSKRKKRDPCYTGWIYRLIWIFAGHTGLIVGFDVRWLIYKPQHEKKKQTSDMYFQQRLKSACTSVPSDQSLCTLGYPKCAQWRFWSDCTTVFIILVLKFNPSPAEPDMSCLCKQCRSRSVGFWRSKLIWIYTVCH